MYSTMLFIKEDDLQTMCLNVIGCNIERFVLQKSQLDDSGNEEKLTAFNFLRQWYSDYLHKFARKKGKKIDCELLDFLLTPHWKRVRLYSCYTSHAISITKLKSIGPGITFLSLKHVSVTPIILNAIICCVPNVVYLNLCGTSCNDSNLHFISKTCKHLKMLNLLECEITDSGMAALMEESNHGSFTALQALNLEGTRISEGYIHHILSHFKTLSHLNFLDLPTVLHNSFLRSEISDQHRFNLKSFDHKCLELLPYPFQLVNVINILNLWASICPLTTRVSIYDAVNQTLLEALSSFEHLERLHLHNIDFFQRDEVEYIHFTNSNFFRLRASHLTTLYLNCSVISLKALLDSCVNLKILSLSSILYTDIDLPASYMNEEKFVKLETLKFMHANGEYDVYKPLQIMLHFAKNLISLGLKYCVKLNRDIVSWIVKMPNLKDLDLSCTDIRTELLLLIFKTKNINVVHTDICPSVFGIGDLSVGNVNDDRYANTVGWKVDYNYTHPLKMDQENKSIFTWSDSKVRIADISK